MEVISDAMNSKHATPSHCSTANTQRVHSRQKRTVVGLLPDEWSTRSLGEIGYCLSGLTYDPSNVRPEGLLVLRASNIGDDGLQFGDDVFVDVEVPDRLLVRTGDLLICVRNGSRPLIGKCALLDGRAQGMTFGAFMSVFRSVDSRFVAYCFQSDIIKRQVHQHLGATINQITKESLNSFDVPFPPQSERRAVAEVLLDVDALLDALDALIVKKRAVQTAAMQRLLAGEPRREGKRDEWGRVKIGEVARIVGGGTPDTQTASYWNGGIPWCVPTDITGDSDKYLRRTTRTITKSGLSNSGACLLPAGSLLLCSRATIGEIKIALTPTCTNQGVKSLVCSDRVLNEFLYYLILTLKPQLVERASGSTFLEISRNALASIEVRLPGIEEQRNISFVLSDMDAEITALAQRRDKIRALKQGMMQQLLTGRTRLVETRAVRETTP